MCNIPGNVFPPNAVLPVLVEVRVVAREIVSAPRGHFELFVWKKIVTIFSPKLLLELLIELVVPHSLLSPPGSTAVHSTSLLDSVKYSSALSMSSRTGEILSMISLAWGAEFPLESGRVNQACINTSLFLPLGDSLMASTMAFVASE